MRLQQVYFKKTTMSWQNCILFLVAADSCLLYAFGNYFKRVLNAPGFFPTLHLL